MTEMLEIEADDFHPRETIVEESASTFLRRRIWTKFETRQLLLSVLKIKSSIATSKGKRNVYEKVVADLERQNLFPNPLSVVDVEAKIKSLIRAYKSQFSNDVRTTSSVAPSIRNNLELVRDVIYAMRGEKGALDMIRKEHLSTPSAKRKHRKKLNEEVEKNDTSWESSEDSSNQNMFFESMDTKLPEMEAEDVENVTEVYVNNYEEDSLQSPATTINGNPNDVKRQSLHQGYTTNPFDHSSKTSPTKHLNNGENIKENLGMREMFDVLIDKLNRTESKEQTIANAIARKLMDLPTPTKTYAEKLIFDVLFNAELGRIDQHTTIS